jgi:hypothetical protein
MEINHLISAVLERRTTMKTNTTERKTLTQRIPTWIANPAYWLDYYVIDTRVNIIAWTVSGILAIMMTLLTQLLPLMRFKPFDLNVPEFLYSDLMTSACYWVIGVFLVWAFIIGVISWLKEGPTTIKVGQKEE